MTGNTDPIRAHYDTPALVDGRKATISAIAPDDQPLSVAQLAMLDQFQTATLGRNIREG